MTELCNTSKRLNDVTAFTHSDGQPSRLCSRPPCKINEARHEAETRRQPTKSRRSRSYSVSSASDYSSRSDRSASRPRRRDSFRPRRDSRRSARDSPPRRVEGDSYIPRYSKLNKPRAPPKKKRDRRPSRADPARRGDNGWQRQRVPEEDRRDSSRQESAQLVETLKEAEALHESEMEEEISLGGSDIETAPPAAPRNLPSAGNGKEHESGTRQPAISIRGIAHSKPAVNNDGKEVDVIRDFGPDLLSRLSGPRDPYRESAAANGSSSSRLAQSHPEVANGIQMKGRGFRKGLVNREMHATLMARLNEERLRSANMQSVPTSPQPGREVDEKTEASLREHVLEVLKQRRQQKANTAPSESNGHYVPAQPVEASKSELKDTTSEKASRLALLQARLAKERAAISPPVPADASAQVTNASDKTRTGEAKGSSPPATNDAATRMAELKKRLAGQKAMREKS